jgi:hypothetical protein
MTTTTTPHVRFRTIDGVRIRYADGGSPQKPAVVLTSPWPEMDPRVIVGAALDTIAGGYPTTSTRTTWPATTAAAGGGEPDG